MKKSIFIFSVFALSLNACTYQKNNRIEQADVNEGNEYVYGVHPDSAARQLKNVYTAKPELAARTKAIQEKFYGPAAEEVVAAPVAVVKADSTKK